MLYFNGKKVESMFGQSQTGSVTYSVSIIICKSIKKKKNKKNLHVCLQVLKFKLSSVIQTRKQILAAVLKNIGDLS